eukprot:gene25016-33525_t
MKFVEFPGVGKDVLAVDCVHPDAYQLTHHLKYSMQKMTMNLLLRGDSSTDAVLNAILSRDEKFSHCKYVTTNHFDIDSFLSVWCSLNLVRAIEFEIILREAAKIGDFRELSLTSPHKKEKDIALRLVCWINSVESKMFYEPFESPISSTTGERDAKEKFDYFLPIFESILLDPFKSIYIGEYWEEYSKVVSEYVKLQTPLAGISTKPSFHRYRDIGLVVVHCLEPMHYYSLFSVSDGRGCLPRVEMKALSRYLNKLENSSTSTTSDDSSHFLESSGPTRIEWCCNSVTDSGPILRREDLLRKLTKAERYGHPFERQIYSSSIAPEMFTATVLSYFNFAYLTTPDYRDGVYDAPADRTGYIQPKIDWTWNEIHEFNRGIDWKLWESLRDAETSLGPPK